MIYTIGHDKNYREALSTTTGDGCSISPKPVMKMGRDQAGIGTVPRDYPGGYAFRTFEDAQTRIDEMGEAYKDFAVFKLDADWEKDTEQAPNGWWHNLMFNREIKLLEE